MRSLGNSCPASSVRAVTHSFWFWTTGARIARVAATAPRITAHLPRFRFVEQTQHGVNELEALKIQTPYVPVGRLWLKKLYESPSVVRCVCRSLESKVAEIESHGIRIPRSISLLGAGSIGLGVAQELAHRGWQVHIYDSNPDVRAQLSHRLTLQHLAVVHDTLHEVLPFGHVCIGASGGTSMTADDYRFLPKNAVLLNIASGNHELSAADMLVLQFLDGSTLGNCTESGSHIEIPVSLLSSPHTAVLDEQDRLWDLFAGEHVCLGVDGNPGQRDRVVHTVDGHSLYFVKSGFVANLHEGPEDPIDSQVLRHPASPLWGTRRSAPDHDSGSDRDGPCDRASAAGDSRGVCRRARENRREPSHTNVLTATECRLNAGNFPRSCPQPSGS